MRWRGDFSQHGGCVLTMEPTKYQCLYLYPLAVYKEVMKGLHASGKQNDPWVMAIRDSLKGCTGDGIDGQGRIKVPEKFCKAAGIGKEALAVGCDSKVELWDPRSYEGKRKPAGPPPDHEGNPSFYNDIKF